MKATETKKSETSEKDIDCGCNLLYFVLSHLFRDILSSDIRAKHTNIQPLQQYRDAGFYKLLLKSLYMLLEKEKDFKELKISQRKLFPKTHFVS